jgi:hypothetical protein
MRDTSAALLRLLVTLPLLAGCPTEPPPRAREPVAPEDDWSRRAPSKEWLYATVGFNGDHPAECSHVLRWVKGEAECKGSICEHGRVLAAEWLDRCPPFAGAEATSAVEEIAPRLTAQAAMKPSPCSESLEAILQGTCGADADACTAAGQGWATRCAKTEGSPLAVRLVERAIEHKTDDSGRAKLDTRSCPDLRADIVKLARCKDKFACGEAAARVTAYRARCDAAEGPPPVVTAIAELAILGGADQPMAPILVKPDAPEEGIDALPVPLADGSGGVLMICDERASELQRYLAARKACQGGKILVARAFKVPRGIEVRAGSLDFPDEATFSARYPTIVAAKETEAREREERRAFEGELAIVGKLGQSAPVESARALTRSVMAHAGALHRSEEVRKAFAMRDEAFAPALVEIGRAKAQAAAGKLPPGDVAGLIQRGQTRAFADLTAEGAAQIGADAPASRLDTTALLPKSMAGYLAAFKKARPRKLDKESVKAAKAAGLAAAARCGDAEKRLTEAKALLLRCGFGLERCDADKTDALTKSLDEARSDAAAAFHTLDLARTGAGVEENAAITRAVEISVCKDPWW